MKTMKPLLWAILLLPFLNSLSVADPAGVAACSGCHDVGDHSPVAFMNQSAHGNLANAQTPMAKSGCESCHGPSAEHMQSPTRVKPAISFGPKWSNSVSEQNAVCESCHQQNAVKGWQQGVHHRENLTCVTCHDLHTDDEVLIDAQAQVCTVCHKPQKSGVHHMADTLPSHPPCAQCHDPHRNPAPQVTLLANRSEGCRSCHDLQAMQADAKVSDAAKTYHKAMARTDRTCIDCHRQVAHVALDQIPAPVVGDKPASTITLFYPGKTNFDWINTAHPGAQPFRQGRNCSQCHAGEQAAMGRALAKDERVAFLDAWLDFRVQGDVLLVTVRWQGSADDSDVAVMFDDGSDESFTRAGCWATCHNDMPGMERNRGQAITKYLSASLQQQRDVGRFAVPYDDTTLADMVNRGHYVELWRANLAGGELNGAQTYQILGARDADARPRVSATAQFSRGEWTVRFAKPLKGAGKPVVSGKEYTFGIAIHGKGQDKAGHWVSLPMTFGINVRDVDFAVKQP